MSSSPLPSTESLWTDLLGRVSALTPSHGQRTRLLPFAQRMYRGYQVGRHHQAIADGLEMVASREIDRLIIEVPPRHGKSLLASVLFPAWCLGEYPETRIIACSYAAKLSRTFSRQTRNLLRSADYHDLYPTVGLAGDARTVDMWELAEPHRGGYVSAGVGGSITGKGADILLIDDPVKDAKAASSLTILDAVEEWYTSTAYTRLHPGGAVILVMTRWAENDLTGRRLAAMEADPSADQWHIIHLPALAEADDTLGREPGAALWPERYSASALARIKTTVGSHNFAALYQQRPSPAEGGIFKREWWKRFPTFDRSQAIQLIQVWDTAFKAKQTNDFSVCSTWALTSHGAYILDVFRARLEFPDLLSKAKDLFAQWRPVAVLIEDKASGQSLIQTLCRETLIPVIAVEAELDKVSRANAVTPYVESGRVFVPASAEWVSDWIEEHAGFPTGAYDDQVDTTSIALKRLFSDPRTFQPEHVLGAVIQPTPDGGAPRNEGRLFD